MELRKCCNHPGLNYPPEEGYGFCFGNDIVRSSGKLWMLDRILVKVCSAGHRVLLFSTMTKLLDMLEQYLQWRTVNGGTSPLSSLPNKIPSFHSPLATSNNAKDNENN